MTFTAIAILGPCLWEKPVGWIRVGIIFTLNGPATTHLPPSQRANGLFTSKFKPKPTQTQTQHKLECGPAEPQLVFSILNLPDWLSEKITDCYSPTSSKARSRRLNFWAAISCPLPN